MHERFIRPYIPLPYKQFCNETLKRTSCIELMEMTHSGCHKDGTF